MVKKSKRRPANRPTASQRAALKKQQHTVKRLKTGSFSFPLRSVRQGWQSSETVQQNYQRLGLCFDPNTGSMDVESMETGEQKSKNSTAIKNAHLLPHTALKRRKNRSALANISQGNKKQGEDIKKLVKMELEAIEAIPRAPAYEAKSMSLTEQARIAKLVEKHGNDYAAMARDIRINQDQLTARQIEKRVHVWKRVHALSEAPESNDTAMLTEKA